MDEKEKEEFWADLGRPEEPTFQYAFTVLVNEDGAIKTEPWTDNVRKKATTFDIYQACREISNDIEALILADRITKSVVEALQSSKEDVKDRLRSALSERGIETPNA